LSIEPEYSHFWLGDGFWSFRKVEHAFHKSLQVWLVLLGPSMPHWLVANN
jgi:hypothetical protein